MNKKSWIIIASIFGLLVIASLLVVGTTKRSPSENPAQKVSVTDKDTHQTINYYPNQSPEATAQSLILLNGEELANFLGPGQYQTVVAQINTLISAKTGQISSGVAKILPGSVGWDDSKTILHATVKQDKPATQFVINIRLTGPAQAEVTEP